MERRSSSIISVAAGTGILLTIISKHPQLFLDIIWMLCHVLILRIIRKVNIEQITLKESLNPKKITLNGEVFEWESSPDYRILGKSLKDS